MVINQSNPSHQTTLREEHVARTRERLIEAAIDLLVSDGADEFSLREIAKRAGVSAPTAYRHFPTKEAMYEALQSYLERKVGDPQMTGKLDDAIEWLPGIHEGFKTNAQLVTAYLRARAARDLRDAGQKRRAGRISSMVKASLPALSGEDHEAFCALVHLFASPVACELWRETWHLEGARAGRVAKWALRELYEAARKNPKAFAAAVQGDLRSTEGKR